MSTNHITSAGIDFGGTSVKIGLCRGPEIIATAERIPTEEHDGPSSLLDAIVASLKELEIEHGEIFSIGIGVPGLVEADTGFIHGLTNVPGWDNYPLRRILIEKTGLPVVVENDANAMAYAEWKYGAGQDKNNIVALTLGTGVGGGVIINGKPLRGATGTAGEVGQMSIDFQGKVGNYGTHGALEKYMGNQEIAEHAIVKYADIGEAKKVKDCSPRRIAEAAQGGDEIARQIWGDVASWLGTALSSIVWVINPEAIIIGGGIAKAGDLLFDPLKQKLASQLSTVTWNGTDVLPAHFGNEAGIIGSAALAAEEVTQVPAS